MKPAPSADAWNVAPEFLPRIDRALAVDAGCRFLFVVLKAGPPLDDGLRARLQRETAARGDAPDAVYAAPDLPCAADGRLLPAAVRRMLTGEPAPRVAAEEGVSNPESLLFFAFLFNNL